MRVEYKPNTDVDLSDLGDSWLCTVRQHGDCSRTGTPYTAVYSQKRNKPRYLGDIARNAMLRDFILETVKKFEAHEVLEWLWVDGERIEDPHGQGTDPDKYRL